MEKENEKILELKNDILKVVGTFNISELEKIKMNQEIKAIDTEQELLKKLDELINQEKIIKEQGTEPTISTKEENEVKEGQGIKETTDPKEKQEVEETKTNGGGLISGIITLGLMLTGIWFGISWLHNDNGFQARNDAWYKGKFELQKQKITDISPTLSSCKWNVHTDKQWKEAQDMLDRTDNYGENYAKDKNGRTVVSNTNGLTCATTSGIEFKFAYVYIFDDSKSAKRAFNGIRDNGYVAGMKLWGNTLVLGNPEGADLKGADDDLDNLAFDVNEYVISNNNANVQHFDLPISNG